MRHTRAEHTPPEPSAQGRPPKGANDAERLVALFVGPYLRDWRAPYLDLGLLYGSAQLQTVRERYFANDPGATGRVILLSRRWFARHCNLACAEIESNGQVLGLHARRPSPPLGGRGDVASHAPSGSRVGSGQFLETTMQTDGQSSQQVSASEVV